MTCKKVAKIKREKAKLVKGSIVHIRAWKRLKIHIENCQECKNGQFDRSGEKVEQIPKAQ